MTTEITPAALAALGIACAAMVAAANAAEIKVISTGAFKPALGELAPAFEKSSGHKVAAIWAGTDEIIRRLGAGETLDIVIAPAPWIDDLTKRGLLVAGSRVDVAKSGIGVAVPAAAPRIDIGSGDALRSALLGAKSIALSTGVSGIYLTALFAKWGIGPDRIQDHKAARRRSGRRRDGARRSRDRFSAGVGIAGGRGRDTARAAARGYPGDHRDLGRARQGGQCRGGRRGAGEIPGLARDCAGETEDGVGAGLTAFPVRLRQGFQAAAGT
jgi:Bacterial extracellular solute-binding protein